MHNKTSRFRFFGGFFVLVLGSALLLLAAAANGPDQELHFFREVPSKMSPDWLDRNVSAPSRWSQWFYSLAKAEVETPLKEGAIVKLSMDPGKGLRKQFELTAKVLGYSPQHWLELEIIGDSTGRLTKVFDHLEWRIELVPTPTGSLIRGTAKAHTCHWRSRMLGKFAERIVMNQVFYPDLMKLSQLRQPFAADSFQSEEYSLWK